MAQFAVKTVIGTVSNGARLQIMAPGARFSKAPVT